MADNAKWFVVHTYSGYENKVASNIKTVVENRGMQDEILDVVIPTEIVREIKDGKEREVERKLFPGYVLVKVMSYKKKERKGSLKLNKGSDAEEIDAFEDDYEEVITMNDEAWYVIRNTRGVTGFVGPESKPSPLKDEELIALGLADKLSENGGEEGGEDDDFLDIFNVKIEVNYSVGDRVSVISGTFEGMSGIVKSIDLEREVVTVNLPVMRRETPTELALDEVELA